MWRVEVLEKKILQWYNAGSNKNFRWKHLISTKKENKLDD